MCKRHTELNILVCCLSREKKNNLRWSGRPQTGFMYPSRAILSSSLQRCKIFVHLIFVVVGHGRNIFNDENFPIYGNFICYMCMYYSQLVPWLTLAAFASSICLFTSAMGSTGAGGGGGGGLSSFFTSSWTVLVVTGGIWATPCLAFFFSFRFWFFLADLEMGAESVGQNMWIWMKDGVYVYMRIWGRSDWAQAIEGTYFPCHFPYAFHWHMKT